MNKLPNFLCVGAQKAGTTTLHDILKQDENIYLPEIKETKFFLDEGQYKKGRRYYFDSYYSNVATEALIGEIDPECMYVDYIPQRIYETLGGDIKIIFMLRNPVDRAFSHYQMSSRREREDLSFHDAVDAEETRLKAKDFKLRYKSYSLNYSYIDRGYYSALIKNYLQFFPIENMHFILFEDEFLKNKEKTIDDLYSFLGVFRDKNVQINLKSNIATEPKVKALNKLIHSEGAIKKIAHIFVPSAFKKALKNFLIGINSRAASDKERNFDKAVFMNKYYRESNKELEVLIGKEIPSWKI
jgi:hypothetical protein